MEDLELWGKTTDKFDGTGFIPTLSSEGSTTAELMTQGF